MTRVADGFRVLLAAALVSAACTAPGAGGALVSGGTAAPAAAAPLRPARPDILLATTTSTQDSGLLDVLIPDFEKRTGYRVKANAVGTGAALAIGARGDADVLLVHAPSVELPFMAAGNGARRHLVFHNDFVLVGPPSDPAGIRGLSVSAALAALSTKAALFISRGDNSGTDILEKGLWKAANLTPRSPWYVEAATGMGQTLRVASEKRAYTITDRSTYLAHKDQVRLDVLIENTPPLLNLYHVITVNAAKFPNVNVAGANAFADYLVSAEGQALAGSFGTAKYGQPLFFPDAGKRDEDVR